MKKIIYHILCNSVTGLFISTIFNNRIPNIRYPLQNKRFNTQNNNISKKIKAMIFFGFYEAAETRLIRKYFPNNLPVFEIGASLGIISDLILSRLNPEYDLTSIEANTHLLETLVLNTQNYDNVIILNKAITYENALEVSFRISADNTEGSIVPSAQEDESKIIKVQTVKLSDIVSRPFVLVCDIEGAEIEFLLNDIYSMSLCQHLFIELHESTYNNKHYSVEELNNLILNVHLLTLIERDGYVFYYQR